MSSLPARSLAPSSVPPRSSTEWIEELTFMILSSSIHPSFPSVGPSFVSGSFLFLATSSASYPRRVCASPLFLPAFSRVHRRLVTFPFLDITGRYPLGNGFCMCAAPLSSLLWSIHARSWVLLRHHCGVKVARFFASVSAFV